MPRKSSEIAPEELAAAARHILAIHVSLPLDELCREAAHLLGYARVTSGIVDDVRVGVDRLVATDEAKRDGDRVVLAAP